MDVHKIAIYSVNVFDQISKLRPSFGSNDSCMKYSPCHLNICS